MVTIQAQNRSESKRNETDRFYESANWKKTTNVYTTWPKATPPTLRIFHIEKEKEQEQEQEKRQELVKSWYKNWKTFAVVFFLYDDDERRQQVWETATPTNASPMPPT